MNTRPVEPVQYILFHHMHCMWVALHIYRCLRGTTLMASESDFDRPIQVLITYDTCGLVGALISNCGVDTAAVKSHVF